MENETKRAVNPKEQVCKSHIQPSDPSRKVNHLSKVIKKLLVTLKKVDDKFSLHTTHSLFIELICAFWKVADKIY